MALNKKKKATPATKSTRSRRGLKSPKFKEAQDGVYASVGQVKARFSEFLRMVAEGRRVVITAHKSPVAQIETVSPSTEIDMATIPPTRSIDRFLELSKRPVDPTQPQINADEALKWSRGDH